MAEPSSPKKPLWRCPKCGHKFVTRNLWHSCGRYRLSDHFREKPPEVRQAFKGFVELARRCGAVTVYAQKTRIVIQARLRFAGVVVRKNWLDASLWLKRQAAHPRLVRIENFGNLGFGHHFRLSGRADIDEALAQLMREAYRIGRQEHHHGGGVTRGV